MLIPWACDVSTLVVEWIEIAWASSQSKGPLSPPSWWSGLKYFAILYQHLLVHVSTLVVEWIEIGKDWEVCPMWNVSTLVVEWIEIPVPSLIPPTVICLHPRGGVD